MYLIYAESFSLVPNVSYRRRIVLSFKVNFKCTRHLTCVLNQRIMFLKIPSTGERIIFHSNLTLGNHIIPDPPDDPEIEGYKTGTVIKTGDTMKLLCTAKGGNPLAQVYWYVTN